MLSQIRLLELHIHRDLPVILSLPEVSPEATGTSVTVARVERMDQFCLMLAGERRLQQNYPGLRQCLHQD